MTEEVLTPSQIVEIVIFYCSPTDSNTFISSAVPPGSRAFQMPTRQSSSAASTLRGGEGGRANLRNASVTFSLFWHEVSLG